jgi:hypothetical protein
MIWIGYGLMWISVSFAVSFTVYTTGSASALCALIIPLFISFSSKRDASDKEKE